jgi:hypothetical protein
MSSTTRGEPPKRTRRPKAARVSSLAAGGLVEATAPRGASQPRLCVQQDEEGAWRLYQTRVLEAVENPALIDDPAHLLARAEAHRTFLAAFAGNGR